MSPLVVVAVAASTLLVVIAACAPRDAPGLCRSQSDCDKSQACLVSRCRPRAEPLVVAEARRVVLEPKQIALLSSKTDDRVDDAAVGFGRTASGDQVLLLEFDAELGPDAELDSAYLVLEPAEKAPSPFHPVPIQVAAIRDAWERELVTWGRQPALGLPENVADATPRASSSLKIDVTRILRSSTRHHGFAVLASASDPVGAFYATGLGGDAPPRLELYLKLVSPSTMASASASASVMSGSSSASAWMSTGGPPTSPRPRASSSARP